MRERIGFRVAEAMPARADVLERMGLAPNEVSARTSAVVESATTEFERLAEPTGLLDDVSVDAFAVVFAGDGRNTHATPLEQIYPQADALALFVATLGGRISTRITELFGVRDMARAYVLDAIASVSADLLTERLAARYREHAPGPATRVLAYSPGYCGWHISAQRRLFERLRPGEIGIGLNDSFLMQPLKSVSGVLVAGAAEIHRFRPEFSCCETCVAKECLPRMRSVR